MNKYLFFYAMLTVYKNNVHPTHPVRKKTIKVVTNNKGLQPVMLNKTAAENQSERHLWKLPGALES